MSRTSLALAGIVILTATLFGARGVPQGQDPAVLLRAAIEKEEVDGNLEAAIEQYKHVVKIAGANRAVAAQALLRLGGCYEKRGQQEARRLYERLVTEYADQVHEAGVARERLAVLAASSKTPAARAAFRSVRMPATLESPGALSPDGRTLAFTAGGSVWTVPLEGPAEPNVTGVPVRLTGPMGARLEVAWSGDGQWLAFNTLEGVFRVRSSGGQPVKILESQRQTGEPLLYRLSLSRDGSRLAYTGGPSSDTSTVHLVSVGGGTDVTVPGRGASMPAFSPDDKSIAFVTGAGGAAAADGREGTAVSVVPARGGEPVLVAVLQRVIGGPVWSTDGSMVAVVEVQASAKAFLCILRASSTGKADAECTRFELPFVPHAFTAGWTPDNRIGLSAVRAAKEAIYTVPATGGRAAQVSPKGSASHPRWSRDGRRIFLRWGDGAIASVPAEGGPVTAIPVDRSVMRAEAVPGGGNAVSPDGKTFAFSGGSRQDDRWITNIWTMPVEGGRPREITHYPSVDTRFPCWSPDGTSIAFVARSDPSDRSTAGVPTFDIYSVGAEGDEPRKLTSAAHRVAWASVAWSPDGTEIAYFTLDKQLAAIPSGGGQPRVIGTLGAAGKQPLGGPGELAQFELAWSPDGQRLVYAFAGRLWTVPRQGGQASEVATGLSDVRPTKLDWSPDGKTIAFTGHEGGDYELWLVEDFVRLLKPAR